MHYRLAAPLIGLCLLLVALNGTCWADDANLSVTRVDALDRIFPDKPPTPASFTDPLSVPRGGDIAFQFGVTYPRDAECEVAITDIVREGNQSLAGSATIYEAIAVPVEANNNGGSRTSVSAVPKDSWMKEFVRKAPFEVAEALRPAASVNLSAGRTHALVVDVKVAADAQPGVYAGALVLKAGADTAAAPFSLRVHGTLAPAHPALQSTHWFFPEPWNLTNGEAPEWWSERHWELIENSGRMMRSFGQDSILTPLIDYEESLIQIFLAADGTYRFDYTRFDRWVELFLRLGYRSIAGHHVSMMPAKWIYGGVSYVDEQTGEKRILTERGNADAAWLAFIPVLYDSLFAHLEEKGWTKLYMQHQLDEPRDDELYRTLAGLAREHMPGVRTIDAINSKPEAFSPLVDIQVFALTILAKQQTLADERRAKGQAVWLYHCCSPYPPYPNRHLDERLSDSRLYPWLAYLLKAEGYLYWGGNVYRGADPYKSSIGPVPNGSQDPGHPPGDNWMYYPGPDGLVGSLRMLAFRDGMLDHTLLMRLAQTDRAAADTIMSGIARDIRDYEKHPEAYHRARQQLLTALDAA